MTPSPAILGVGPFVGATITWQPAIVQHAPGTMESNGTANPPAPAGGISELAGPAWAAALQYWPDAGHLGIQQGATAARHASQRRPSRNSSAFTLDLAGSN